VDLVLPDEKKKEVQRPLEEAQADGVAGEPVLVHFYPARVGRLPNDGGSFR